MAVKKKIKKDIENYLRDEIKKIAVKNKNGKVIKSKAYKFKSPGTLGVPDRLVLLPYGISIFVELKRPGEETRSSQNKQIELLRGLGNDVHVIDTFEKADKFIDMCKHRVVIAEKDVLKHNHTRIK